MSTTNKANTPITELDFDGIKSSLKDFLRGQDQFKDYDFEGSSMSSLLDLLAYNGHYQAWYANMVAKEMFLSSATKRGSVVSRAKHLGYVPRSTTAPVATVDVDFGTASTNPLASQYANYIPRGTVFNALLSSTDGVYTENTTFLTLQPWEVRKIVDPTSALDGHWVAKDVLLYEGTYRQFSYSVDTSSNDFQYVIPDPDIDTTTLVIRVQQSMTDTTGLETPWQLSTDITTIDRNSKVYFLEEMETGDYRIYFGDGILGKNVENGNVVIMEYLITHGPLANGTGSADTPNKRTFSCQLAVPSATIVTVPANGGGDKETIDSIKFYAPKVFQSQDRAVVASDYQALVARDFANIDSIYVWGGEENVPPQYGKVYISIKPMGGTVLSTAEKLSIADTIVKKRNVVGVTPVVVDPEYTYMLFDVAVRYDVQKTVKEASGIQQLVERRIRRYGQEQLGKFQRNFRYSTFLTYIDESDPSILNNTTKIRLQRRFYPRFGTTSTYVLSFNNAVYHPYDGFSSPVVTSTPFTYYSDADQANVTTYIDDDGNGNLRLYKIVNNAKVCIKSSIGTVNYTNGEIVLTDFAPVSVEDILGGTIRINMVPNDMDVATERNQILMVDPLDVLGQSMTVTVAAELTNNG